MSRKTKLLTAALIAVCSLAVSNWLASAQPQPGQPEAIKPQPTDSLDGTWELISLIEDGKPIPSEIVKQTMVANARIVISGQLLAFEKPDGKVKTLAFTLDPSASPKRMDLAGAINLGSKGIYLRDSDTLLVCFPMTDTESRPTEYVSLPGKNSVVMTFTRVKVVQPAAIKPTAIVPPPVAAKTTDEEYRTALVGTWGHQSDERIVKGTLNSDDSFSIVVTYKKGLKKVFHTEERSSGTWRVKDGVVIMTTKASTEPSGKGQVVSYRISSINASEAVYIDNETGGRRVEWKLR
jgi:uncharacterized protein (TIGR03067 family)